MAHQIQIPFSFEFRMRRVVWEQISAHVVGLDGKSGLPQLIAQIGATEQLKSIKLLLSNFPADEAASLIGAAEKTKNGNEEDVLTKIELNVFVPAQQIPIVDREIKKHTQPANAWEMRDDFLRMAAGAKGVQTFLNKWGRWHQTRALVEARELLTLQREVRDALVSSPGAWFSTGNAFLPAVDSASVEFPYFARITDVCREAICLATTVDLLRRVEFRVCARPDCELPFKVVSKHSKQYCTQYCAHLESVRRNRKAVNVKSERVVSNESL